MQIAHDKVETCLEKVQKVREYIEKYSVEPMGFVLNLADLKVAIENLCGMAIEVFEVSFSGDHLRGSTERFSDSTAKIYVRSSQTDEEKRLAVTKELCHILLDCEDDWSTEGVETISGLLRETRLARVDGIGEINPSNQLASEVMAHVVALELLYPDQYHKSDEAKLLAGEKTLQQIAFEHEVPAYAIEQALDRHAELETPWEAVRERFK